MAHHPCSQFELSRVRAALIAPEVIFEFHWFARVPLARSENTGHGGKQKRCLVHHNHAKKKHDRASLATLLQKMHRNPKLLCVRNDRNPKTTMENEALVIWHSVDWPCQSCD
jgi:hypothetical protein